MIAVGVIFAPRFYRLSRGMAQALREESYVDAARSMGFTQRRILWRHVLPNALPALIVQVTFTFGFAVVAEAGLSFLGLGVQVPDTSLGLLVRDGFTQVRVNSFPFFPPAVLVTVIVFVFASLGDALQDSLGLGGDRASR
jgi:peptide/nickel transport system permease protein